ncbi:hypothetical protein RHSIM_Rhsim11G0069000 [Rhododendron simsii]|uniref:F-box protein Hrt3/FBXO9 C-terminal domain-containing protein n=1 Tax=Rhododendron simsii TaxID=118357 RepID=A0A834G7W4_RHOSS|nr:hypothetical protein RHSIM_Rhsim11G0069000 [Rhododendron simsii]
MVRFSARPDEGILRVVEGWREDETHNLDVSAVTHKIKGSQTFGLHSIWKGGNSVLNLPVERMDYFVPG